MFFQPNYHVLEIVVSKDSTLEENIDTLVGKRAYINKDAEYVREDIIRFSNEQPELSWPPNVQELTSEIPKAQGVLKIFLTEFLMPSNTKERNKMTRFLDLIFGVTCGKYLTTKPFLIGNWFA